MNIVKNYYFLVAERKSTEMSLLNSFVSWRFPLTEIWVHNATIRDPPGFPGEGRFSHAYEKVKSNFEGEETRPGA